MEIVEEDPIHNPAGPLVLKQRKFSPSAQVGSNSGGITFWSPCLEAVPAVRADFKLLQVVGSGTYGNVYKAYDLANGNQLVALKHMKWTPASAGGFPLYAVREIQLLKRLCHPNLLRLLGIMAPPPVEVRDNEDPKAATTSLYLVFEFAHFDLSGLIRWRRISGFKTPLFSIPEIKRMLLQLFSGIDFMHARGLMHRDLKSTNILLTKDGTLKVADFDLSRMYQVTCALHEARPEFTNKVISLWYRPPELLLGATAYGPEVDIWSAGLMAAELVIGRPLFRAKSEMQLLEDIFQLCGSPDRYGIWQEHDKLPLWNEYRQHNKGVNNGVQLSYDRSFLEFFRDTGLQDPQLLDLLDWMFCLNPADRPTAEEILRHEFFRTAPPPCESHQITLPTETCHDRGMKERMAALGQRGAVLQQAVSNFTNGRVPRGIPAKQLPNPKALATRTQVPTIKATLNRPFTRSQAAKEKAARSQ